MDSNPIYLKKENRTANEPKVHPLIKDSFVFVPSTGMRLAPEVLVLEFMRELFFERHFEDTKGTKYLDPEESDEERRYCRELNERAVMYALRGRRKKSKISKAESFFAPAYPALAERAWLRKNEARVINGLLLGGPVAQHLWSRGKNSEEKEKEQDKIAKMVRMALVGKNSFCQGGPEGKEILSVALGRDHFSGDFGTSGELCLEKFKHHSRRSDAVFETDFDELSECITDDLVSICGLEEKLPRLQWVQVLMAFLRLAQPVWLLAQMRITVLLHSWILDAIDHGRIRSKTDILYAIKKRNRELLHPNLVATRELFEHVDVYMKRRVEVSIFLYCLQELKPDELAGRKLKLDEAGQGTLGIEQLLVMTRDVSAELKSSSWFRDVAPGLNVETFLTRTGEQFPGWRNPRMRGQGKNIDEFFRVMYRAEAGDEAGGFLLTPEGRGHERGFRVFPGQLLLKTVTYLAANSKRLHQGRDGAGKLVLQDVEDKFAQYGVDFSCAADARPLLMRELQDMGLLAGSPDAGSSVAVACPY